MCSLRYCPMNENFTLVSMVSFTDVGCVVVFSRWHLNHFSQAFFQTITHNVTVITTLHHPAPPLRGPPNHPLEILATYHPTANTSNETRRVCHK